MPNECQCSSCKRACESRPGWFLPGEAEKAAKFLGLTIEEFFKKYLGVDWWEGTKETDWGTVFVLAPALKTANAGEEYPGDPRGECVFYENGLCKIHPVKPYECAEYNHDDSERVTEERHKRVALAWNTEENQKQIIELLGREPIAAEFEGGLLSWLLP